MYSKVRFKSALQFIGNDINGNSALENSVGLLTSEDLWKQTKIAEKANERKRNEGPNRI